MPKKKSKIEEKGEKCTKCGEPVNDEGTCRFCGWVK